MAQVQFYPLQYDSATGELHLYRRILARITWDTPLSVMSTGFNLYRATAPGCPYTKNNAALIAAEGDPVAGASYSFLNKGLAAGTYYYKLEDVDYYGVTTLHGPVSAAVLPGLRKPSYRPVAP